LPFVTNPQGDPRVKPPSDQADALAVLKRLRSAGQIAYFAGGCVRDKLMGREPKDWDVATDAPPNRVRELFESTAAVGAAFGVVLVRQGKSVIEVATFRADGIYEDGRRPSSVRFTSAEEDAKRRDFTINGLFLDPLEDRVIDYVEGRKDLEARRLRAIGNASERFAEDHLRLLRAVRFAARFGLQIDPGTAEAIRRESPRLAGISPERVGDELRLMFPPPTRATAWRLLWEFGLAKVIFRFLPNLPTTMELQRSIFLNVAPAESVSFALAVAAATLCCAAQANPAANVRSFLTRQHVGGDVRAMRQVARLSNEESDEMSQTLAGIAPLLADAKPTLAQKKRFLAQPTSPQSRRLMGALAAVNQQRQRFAELQPELNALQSEDVAPLPLLTGDDLTRAGFIPGPKFKRILDDVYDAQLEGTISTKPEALALAKTI
jgi:poly(A) polymerase